MTVFQGSEFLSFSVSRAESPKAHSPGQHPGFFDVIAIKRPARAKALFSATITLLPLQGVSISWHTKPRVPLRSALGYVLLPFQGGLTDNRAFLAILLKLLCAFVFVTVM